MEKSRMKRKYTRIPLLLLALIITLLLSVSSVSAATPTIKLNKTSAVLYLKEQKTIQLKATVTGPSTKVTWKSSNPAIASVGSKGKVTAKKTGKVTITAKANGKTAKCTITVKKYNVTDVKMSSKLDSKGTKVTYTLEGKTKSGKTVWTYTSAAYTAAQLSDLQFKVFKNYVYVLEGKYFIKLNKSTGKTAVRTKVWDGYGSPIMYIDSKGTLYATHYYSYAEQPPYSYYYLYKISSSGKLIWRDTLKTKLFWPCKIESRNGKLVISFEGDDGGSMTHKL